MNKSKPKTKTKNKSKNLADTLNQFATHLEVNQENATELAATEQPVADTSAADQPTDGSAAYDSLFEAWDEREFRPQDFMVAVPVGSLEACVGYSSLFRQMHDAFIRRVAFHTSPEGGSLSTVRSPR